MTLNQLLDVAHSGSQICRTLLPDSPFLPLYSALLCGQPLEPGLHRQLFLDAGLIHIFVVSGAHLLFLERWLRFLPWTGRMGLLLIYSWLTGFGVPVIKALIRRGLEPWSEPHGWSQAQTEAVAIAITLLIWPPWFFTRSFLMSWVCALAFVLPVWIKPTSLDYSLKIYLLMYIFCASSCVTIFWNALLAPVVGAVLFPACLVTVVVPQLTALVDLIWHALLYILNYGPTGNHQNLFISSRQIYWWPLMLHALLLIGEVRWRRKFAFS